MAKKTLIVGNWKMYIETADEAKKFASGLRRKAASFKNTEILLAPPFTLLPTLSAVLKKSKLKVGAQSVSQFVDEKRTGEVSAHMAKNIRRNFYACRTLGASCDGRI
jgi:triosephosphate isomerase